MVVISDRRNRESLPRQGVNVLAYKMEGMQRNALLSVWKLVTSGMSQSRS